MKELYPPEPSATIDWSTRSGRVVVNGKPVSVGLRPSARATRYRARLVDGSFELVIPRRGTRALTERAFLEIAPWIAKTAEEEARRRAEIGEDSLWLRGRKLRLIADPDVSEPFLASDAEWRVRTTDPAQAAVFAGRLLAAEAAKDIGELIPNRLAEMGLRAKAWQLRDMSSRWGSCSADGSIRFNWRIVMAPHEVLNYLVVHELAHLVVRGHGPRFWALVERHCPESRGLDRWLTDHGRQIMEALPKLKADDWDPLGILRRAQPL